MNKSARLLIIGGVCILAGALIMYSYNKKGLVDTLYRPASIKQGAPVFRVKIKSHDYYYVVFTNDNFATEQVIMEVFDSSGHSGPGDVVYQGKRFLHQKDAIDFSKQFKTYEHCIQYNKRIEKEYENLLSPGAKNAGPVPVPMKD